MNFYRLTVTVQADSRLPKYSKMLITAEMSTIAQKWLKRLPLKFKDDSFGAIKMSQKYCSSEISTAMNRKISMFQPISIKNAIVK